jgi:diacylglycerol kinase (ATP)
MSGGAGSMTPAVATKLRKAFADHLVIDFDPTQDFEELITPDARVVVAGGDGTIGFVVRKLADTPHPLGILSLGTFNNFARALKLPVSLAGAIRVMKEGRAREITLGRVNGTVFLEAAAVGLFGETIALGEAAKDRVWGNMATEMRRVMKAKPFRYELSGDIEGSGSAMSLVFTNTESIGAQMPVGESSPSDPYLELSIHAGESRTDIVGRVMASSILKKTNDRDKGQVFRFRKLQVTTRPMARVYADNARIGRTPASVTAEVSALKVILPAPTPPASRLASQP